MPTEVKLPEIGDGIESGDVLEVLVSEGDMIEKGQDIVELETDKATMNVPSSSGGRITKIHVKEGDSVPVGGVLISVEAESGEEAEEEEPEKPAPKKEEKGEAKSAEKSEKKEKKEEKKEEKKSKTPKSEEEEDEVPEEKKSSKPARREPVAVMEESDVALAAGPAVRRFARETGVDLRRVKGTGEGGRITREDVLAVVRSASSRQAAEPEANKKPPPGDAATDEFGPVRIEKMAKIRKTIAKKMAQSWSTAPRVTNFDDADITELEHFRQGNKADYEKAGIKLTSLPFIIKAVALSLRSNPALNAVVDMEEGNIIYKEYVNIGLAVDTDRGLVVPVLPHADQLPIPSIARAVAKMASDVRGNSFDLSDLRGGTFTISNLGAIGGTYSTPIINVPEVAILLVGRSRKLPIVVDDEIVPRLMMPLSLSYDHRLVDGAAAARFLNSVIAYLETPSRLFLAP